MSNEEMASRLEDLLGELQERAAHSEDKERVNYYGNLDYTSQTEELMYCPPELMSDSQLLLAIEKLKSMMS